MDAGNELPLIKFLTGPLAGRTFVISKPITTIGRDPTNDIVVGNDQRVSRQHARLLWQSGTWSIENLSQRAVLTVDQRDTQQALIGDNTIIGLGADTSFVFLAQAETPMKQSRAPEEGRDMSAPTVIRPQGDREGSTPGQPRGLHTIPQMASPPPPYKYRFFTLGRGHVPARGVFVVFGAPFPCAIFSCSGLKVWAVSGAR